MNKILFLLIIISQTSISQTLNDLDFKNGFKHFKLGSSPSQNKNITKDDYQPKDINFTYYKYIGNDLSFIGECKVFVIKLTFFKNKLFMIGIEFGNPKEFIDFEEIEYNTILSKLELAYGKNWIKLNSRNNDLIDGIIWEGKKVSLELRRTKLKNYTAGLILVFDNEINRLASLNTF